MQSNISSGDNGETERTISPQEIGFLSLSISYIIIINNAIVLAVFTNLKPFKLCYHIIIRLAVADIMTLIPLDFSVVASIRPYVLLTDQIHNVMQLATMAPVVITSWLQCLLCLEKCMSVRKPMSHRRFLSHRNSATKMKVAVTLVCLMVPALLSLFIILGIIDFDFVPAAATFGLRRQSLQLFVYISLAEVPKILIQAVCCTLMFNKLKSLQGYNKRQGQQALKLVLLTFVLFYACFSPMYVKAAWMVLRKVLHVTERPPAWFNIFWINATALNSAMSSAICYVSMPAFKKCVQKPASGTVNYYPKLIHTKMFEILRLYMNQVQRRLAWKLKSDVK